MPPEDSSATPWHRDRSARRLIVYRYLPWLASLSLAWEIAQLPLYTIWQEGSPAWIAFAVAHCTAGDAMIGLAALAIALTTMRSRELRSWRWLRIASLTAIIALAYTVFSEWRNTALLGNWAYSTLMPVIGTDGVSIGLAPLLQWLVIPPLALRLSQVRRRGASA